VTMKVVMTTETNKDASVVYLLQHWGYSMEDDVYEPSCCLNWKKNIKNRVWIKVRNVLI